MTGAVYELTSHFCLKNNEKTRWVVGYSPHYV